MRLAFAVVLLALALGTQGAEEVSKDGEKSARSVDAVAPKVYYARQQQQQVAQARDGAGHGHHHHHEHPVQAAPAYPIYEAQQPAYEAAPVAYDAAPVQPSYEAAPVAYEAQQPAYEAAPVAYEAAPVQPAYEAAPVQPAYESVPVPAQAPTYSTPGHQGYYYYYYPVKDHKAKLKFPKFKLPSLPSFPSLHLPQSYGKDGGLSSAKTMGMAAATSLLVAGGLFLSLPIIGLGVGRRSLNTIWESEYFNRDNMNALADFVLNIIETYEQKQK